MLTTNLNLHLALSLLLMLAALVLTIIQLVDSKGKSPLAWAVLCIVLTLLLPLP